MTVTTSGSPSLTPAVALAPDHVQPYDYPRAHDFVQPDSAPAPGVPGRNPGRVGERPLAAPAFR